MHFRRLWVDRRASGNSKIAMPQTARTLPDQAGQVSSLVNKTKRIHV